MKMIPVLRAVLLGATLLAAGFGMAGATGIEDAVNRLASLQPASLQPASSPSATLPSADYQLGAGDTIRIQVYQNADLSLETRLSEGGSISYPLIGTVELGGDTLAKAEQTIAAALKNGGFVQQPQVNISLVQVRGNQVSVMGMANRPGRYPLETATTRISEILTIAGGIAPGGADSVILMGMRDGKPMRNEIDIAGLFLDDRRENDMAVLSGDVIYIHRAPMIYIYGEVQRPGTFRLERNMTVRQAMVQGGGPTLRGSESRLRLHRRVNGQVVQSVPELADLMLPDDVLFIRESLF